MAREAALAGEVHHGVRECPADAALPEADAGEQAGHGPDAVKDSRGRSLYRWHWHLDAWPRVRKTVCRSSQLAALAGTTEIPVSLAVMCTMLQVERLSPRARRLRRGSTDGCGPRLEGFGRRPCRFPCKAAVQPCSKLVRLRR
jgi:hypothetical protein